MKQTINFSQFVDAFNGMGRGKQFSYDGLKALFDYLEQYGEDTGEEVELDVIALCCEYSELDSLGDYNSQYDPAESIEDIGDLTTVITLEDGEGFIIQQY